MSLATGHEICFAQAFEVNLGKVVENKWSKILGGKKLIEKELAKNSPAENSSQEQIITSGKYSPYFVITPCYEVLNYYEVLHCKLYK